MEFRRIPLEWSPLSRTVVRGAHRTIALLVLGVLPWLASAQTTSNFASPAWPNKPIRLVVGFAPGGGPDVTARIIAPALARVLGQPVVVDNRPGASGNIASGLVVRANDDHTVGYFISSNLTTAKLLNPKLPVDPATDFGYVSLVTTNPMMLVAPIDQPGGKDFFDAARKSGNKWNYASVGIGSNQHLWIELLKTKMPGFNPVHIPYGGVTQVVTALNSGQVHMSVVSPTGGMPQIRGGKLRAIGLTAPRSPLAPDIPSLAELGIDVYNYEGWSALAGPANLSGLAVSRLGAALAAISREEEMRQLMLKQGSIVASSTPEALRQRIREETAQLGAIISSRGIRLDEVQ